MSKKPTPADTMPAVPKPKPSPQLAMPPTLTVSWQPTVRFVDFRRRKITIKLEDAEEGFKASESVMTAAGPVFVSHSHVVAIDSDGYLAKSAAEERALMKLANRPTHASPGGSYLVTWENREMPPEQAKAELSAAGYQARIAELEGEIAGKAELEAENARQAARLAELEAQLNAAQGG